MKPQDSATSTALGAGRHSHPREPHGLGQGHWVEFFHPHLAGGALGERAPECSPEQLLLFAVGFALPRPWPRSWCISLPSEAFHFCSASCLEGEWGWVSSAWRRHCWRSAASSAPWCLWRSFWSCPGSWDGREKGIWWPTHCKRPSDYHMFFQEPAVVELLNSDVRKSISSV